MENVDLGLLAGTGWNPFAPTPAPAPAPVAQTSPLSQPGGVTTTSAPTPAPSVAAPTTAPVPSPAPAPYNPWGGVQNEQSNPYGFGVGGTPTPAPAPAPAAPNNTLGIPTYGPGDDWRGGEAYNATALPQGFNWKAYSAANPDLGQVGLDTQQELERHYLLYGKQEGRPYGATTAPAPSPWGGVQNEPQGGTTGGTGSTGSTAGQGTQGTFQEAYGPMYADLLAKINAWANSPYQGYRGERVAGPNQAQQDALASIQNAQLPPEVYSALQQMMGLANQGAANPYEAMQFSSYLPGTSAENPYAVGSIQDYMSPYLSEALAPQLRELQRQADLQRMADEARLAKAGAYGGSRQAILQGENNRNASQLQSDVLAKGYQDAYNRALEQQLGASKLSLEAQGLTDKSNQFAAGYGLDALKQQLAALGSAGQFGMDIGNFDLNRGKALGDIGNLLWGIEQKGLDSDYEMFKDERDSPINKLLTAVGALNSANSASRDPTGNTSSSAANILSSLSGIMSLLDSLGGS